MNNYLLDCLKCGAGGFVIGLSFAYFGVLITLFILIALLILFVRFE